LLRIQPVSIAMRATRALASTQAARTCAFQSALYGRCFRRNLPGSSKECTYRLTSNFKTTCLNGRALESVSEEGLSTGSRSNIQHDPATRIIGSDRHTNLSEIGTPPVRQPLLCAIAAR